MTCRHVASDDGRSASVIVCSRERPRDRRPRCRHPECERAATQAGWGCRPHWFKLPPDLRARLWRAAQGLSLDYGGRPSAAWTNVADEADRWLAEREARALEPSRRQPELPL